MKSQGGANMALLLKLTVLVQYDVIMTNWKEKWPLFSLNISCYIKDAL